MNAADAYTIATVFAFATGHWIAGLVLGVMAVLCSIGGSK